MQSNAVLLPNVLNITRPPQSSARWPALLSSRDSSVILAFHLQLELIICHTITASKCFLHVTSDCSLDILSRILYPTVVVHMATNASQLHPPQDYEASFTIYLHLDFNTRPCKVELGFPFCSFSQICRVQRALAESSPNKSCKIGTGSHDPFSVVTGFVWR